MGLIIDSQKNVIWCIHDASSVVSRLPGGYTRVLR